MRKMIGVGFVAAAATIGVLMQETSAQGICWDGTTVKNLKDCPKQPGTKLQTLNSMGSKKQGAAVPRPALSNSKKSTGQPVPMETPSFNFTKIDTYTPAPKSKGKSPPPPPPKDDCMSCAD